MKVTTQEVVVALLIKIDLICNQEVSWSACHILELYKREWAKFVRSCFDRNKRVWESRNYLHKQIEDWILHQKGQTKGTCICEELDHCTFLVSLARVDTTGTTLQHIVKSVLNGTGKIAGTLICCAACSPALHKQLWLSSSVLEWRRPLIDEVTALK